RLIALMVRQAVMSLAQSQERVDPVAAAVSEHVRDDARRVGAEAEHDQFRDETRMVRVTRRNPARRCAVAEPPANLPVETLRAFDATFRFADALEPTTETFAVGTSETRDQSARVVRGAIEDRTTDCAGLARRRPGTEQPLEDPSRVDLLGVRGRGIGPRDM